MRLINVAVSAGLLLSIVSCGDKSSHSKRAPAIDPLVTSADWKIVLEGKSFPHKAMVSIDDEIVVNECADKQSYFIDREANPENLPLPAYKVPLKNTVKIEVTDMGDCSGRSESSFFANPETHYEMTKNGAHADVLIRL